MTTAIWKMAERITELEAGNAKLNDSHAALVAALSAAKDLLAELRRSDARTHGYESAIDGVVEQAFLVLAAIPGATHAR